MSNKPHLQINGQTDLFGLLGTNVSHSASMSMHNAAFAELDINARYLPLNVKPCNLEKALNGGLALGFCGMNVTIPHKELAVKFLDKSSSLVSAVGATNTLIYSKDTLLGANTDVLGLWKALQLANITVRERPVLIIGAGGAARAAAHCIMLAAAEQSLEQFKAQQQQELVGSVEASLTTKNTNIDLTILNRSPSRAEEVARSLSTQPEAHIRCCSELDVLPPGALIIQCTPVGMAAHFPHQDPLEAHSIEQDHCVVELITSPSHTPIVHRAIQANAQVLLGEEMLLWQAVFAQELWQNQSLTEKTIESMRTALRIHLDAEAAKLEVA